MVGPVLCFSEFLIVIIYRIHLKPVKSSESARELRTDYIKAINNNTNNKSVSVLVVAVGVDVCVHLCESGEVTCFRFSL